MAADAAFHAWRGQNLHRFYFLSLNFFYPGSRCPAISFLDIFEGGAAPGRDAADLFGNPGLMDGCRRISTPTILKAEGSDIALAMANVIYPIRLCISPVSP